MHRRLLDQRRGRRGARREALGRAYRVGVGTAYRRFGSRSELIAALFDERLEQMVALAEEALRAEDAWQGLAGFIERSTDLQASNRGLKEILLGSAEGRQRIADVRRRMQPLGTRLVARAQEAGVLRSDFVPQDLPMIQIMLGGIADASAAVDPDLWRRYLSLILAGMRVEGELAGSAPDWKATAGVMDGWRPPRRD